jgi:hypothetical protein
MRVPRLGRAIALAATVLLVGACTGGGSAPSAGGNGGASASVAPAGSSGGGGNAGSLNACDLLSTDEIKAAVGWPVGTGLLQNTDTQTDCEWDGQGDQAGSVGLTVANYDDSLWQAGSSAGSSTAVSGIGDAAYKGWPHAGDLAIKVGSYEVDVAIIDFYKAGDKVDAEDLVLAKLVLPRL